MRAVLLAFRGGGEEIAALVHRRGEWRHPPPLPLPLLLRRRRQQPQPPRRSCAAASRGGNDDVVVDWRTMRPRRGGNSSFLAPTSSSSSSSAIVPPDDSFHGISLDSSGGGGRGGWEEDDDDDGIPEAEVVTSEEDRRIARMLVLETTRAAMSAHSRHRPTTTTTTTRGAGGIRRRRDDDESSPEDGDDDDGIDNSGPYGRRLRALDEAQSLLLQQQRHERERNDDESTTRSSSSTEEEEKEEYVRRCMVVGELQFELGRMDDSRTTYATALGRLVSGHREDEDDDDDGRGRLATRAMISRCMHRLGSIHARCGELDDARRWYDESMKATMRILDDVEHLTSDGDDDDVDDATIGSMIRHHRHELGKTYNGLAALEATRGGDAHWERAMALFREAERNYLHGFEVREKSSEEFSNPLEATGASSTEVTKVVIQQMTPRRVESLINVRSNVGELLRLRGRYEAAAETVASALDMAKMALEDAHDRAASVSMGDAVSVSTGVVDGPGLDEQRNAIVDLLIQMAGIYMSANRFDEAAEAYERALSSHVYFRRWSEGNDRMDQLPNRKTVLPANTSVSTNPPKFDLTVATIIEATIRRNLAHALAQIGQDKLSLEHYAASLAIKRHTVGDSHLEVAHTLMDMGALIGGPMRDFTKALICFKEALYIYRTNLEEMGENRNAESSARTFFDDEDAKEINRSVENALKNISLLEAALLKDRDGASTKRRR